MSESTRSRRVIALFAAYVVALQALLLPLSVAAGPFKSRLCAAAMSADGAPPPAGHDSGCPCAAGFGTHCCAQTLASPPVGTVILALSRALAMMPMPAIERVIRVAVRSPQVPRAPPAV